MLVYEYHLMELALSTNSFLLRLVAVGRVVHVLFGALAHLLLGSRATSHVSKARPGHLVVGESGRQKIS